MTRDRVTRLARLARAQRAVADLRASETARLHEAHGECAAAAGQIVDALNGDSPLHGLLVDVMANALMRNAIDTARLNSQRNAAAEVERRESVRADAFERRAGEAGRDLARTQARLGLDALLEEYARRQR